MNKNYLKTNEDLVKTFNLAQYEYLALQRALKENLTIEQQTHFYKLESGNIQVTSNDGIIYILNSIIEKNLLKGIKFRQIELRNLLADCYSNNPESNLITDEERGSAVRKFIRIGEKNGYIMPAEDEYGYYVYKAPYNIRPKYMNYARLANTIANFIDENLNFDKLIEDPKLTLKEKVEVYSIANDTLEFLKNQYNLLCEKGNLVKIPFTEADRDELLEIEAMYDPINESLRKSNQHLNNIRNKS